MRKWPAKQRLHPHVFGDKKYESEAELKAAWESIKAEERRVKQSGRSDLFEADQFASALDGVSVNLPALKKSDKIQKRAAGEGFDWANVQPVWLKLEEEVSELKEAVREGNAREIEDELGDLLFTVVNLARHLGVDSETALQQSVKKFSQRFRTVERLAAENDQSMSALTLYQLDTLWDRAKKELKDDQP